MRHPRLSTTLYTRGMPIGTARGRVHGAGARAPSDGAAGGGAKDDVIDAEFEDKS